MKELDIKQRSTRAWQIFEDLKWLKSTALERLVKEMPHLEIDEAEVKEVGFLSDGDPVEEGDIIVWIHLSIYIDNVSPKQIDDLQEIGDITILDFDYVKQGVSKCRIEYKTAYGFTFWDGKALLEDGFSGFTDG
jgi:hypothetical protein